MNGETMPDVTIKSPSDPPETGSQTDQSIAVLAERLRVTKRIVETDKVKIEKTVSQTDAVVEALLARRDVRIERVAINRVVTEAPPARQEGDIWVFPVLSETLVVEKRLLLKEEVRIHFETKDIRFDQTFPLREEHVSLTVTSGNGPSGGGAVDPSQNGAHMNDTLSSTGTHSSGAPIYDPDKHDNQIVAIYENRSLAQSAMDALLNKGVTRSSIELLDQSSHTPTGDHAAEGGFWASMKNLFAPDDETHAYTHAIGQGNALLVVTPENATMRHSVVEVLEATHPLDFDAKMSDWQQSGYDYSQPHQSLMVPSSIPATGGPSINTGLPATEAAATTSMPLAASATGTKPTDTINVLEERLRVGKREVSQGVVRVRSYIVERPVQEQVTLHEEHVTIDRQPVDRVATPGDMAAFEERTIVAEGFKEEAVVDKEVRVVEVINLHKDGTDKVETVHETVRKTEVEIDGEAEHGNHA